MHYIIEKYNNIFLKMDIESHEWRWILETDMSRFRQIVVEFHGIFNGHVENTGTCPLEKMYAVFKLNKTHNLVHVHGNNAVELSNSVPWVGEFTYLRKDVPINGFNKTPFPIPGLDFPNPSRPDYSLNTWPFVF